MLFVRYADVEMLHLLMQGLVLQDQQGSPLHCATYHALRLLRAGLQFSLGTSFRWRNYSHWRFLDRWWSYDD